MQIETTTYKRKPLLANAIQVTAENMQAVATWCGGEVQEWPNESYIKVHDVNRPYSQRQTQAFVGDFVVVLVTGNGFKVYPPRAFAKSFDSLEETVLYDVPEGAAPVVHGEKKHSHKAYRDAGTGEYVTKEYAEKYPDSTVSETVEDEDAMDPSVAAAVKQANESGPIKATSKPSPVAFATGMRADADLS